MSFYPNLNNERQMLEKKQKEDEIEYLKNKTEKHDHGNISKLTKIDNE